MRKGEMPWRTRWNQWCGENQFIFSLILIIFTIIILDFGISVFGSGLGVLQQARIWCTSPQHKLECNNPAIETNIGFSETTELLSTTLLPSIEINITLAGNALMCFVVGVFQVSLELFLLSPRCLCLRQGPKSRGGASDFATLDKFDGATSTLVAFQFAKTWWTHKPEKEHNCGIAAKTKPQIVEFPSQSQYMGGGFYGFQQPTGYRKTLPCCRQRSPRSHLHHVALANKSAEISLGFGQISHQGTCGKHSVHETCAFRCGTQIPAVRTSTQSFSTTEESLPSCALADPIFIVHLTWSSLGTTTCQRNGKQTHFDTDLSRVANDSM